MSSSASLSPVTKIFVILTIPFFCRTLGTALTTLLLILLSIVLSSTTSLATTIQTMQVPATTHNNNNNALGAVLSRSEWAETHAGEWSAYVSAYYYVIDAPLSSGSASDRQNSHDKEREKSGGGGGDNNSAGNNNNNNNNKPSRHQSLIITPTPRNSLTAWLDGKLMGVTMPVLSATKALALLSSLPLFVAMPGMVNNVKVNDEGFGSVEGVLEGLFGSGIGVKAGEFYWRYYTASEGAFPFLAEEGEGEIGVVGYLSSLVVRGVATCTFLIALHSVPQLLELNHVPKRAIYLVGFAWLGVDMRPEIGVAAGAGGAAVSQSWKLAGSMVGAMVAGKLCREWFPV